ncbi:MAG: hypothetical protein ACKVXR_04485 [Planctomycetota bacterium]
MRTPILALPLTAAALLVAATLGTAQIERLDLKQMVEKADNAVFGTIVNKHVIRIDHPVDGPELYFTTLTIEGRSLRDDKELTVDVVFAGGFIDEENGVNNSEAPSADDTRIGNRVVAFYKWSENLGGQLAGNGLYASHGGLYRTIETRGRTVVLGRGEGYAIERNVEHSALQSEVASIVKAPK